ncbi:hypothetical protein [Methanobacterium sp.]|jgi:hypothetical protein|uniref:hypothetical protein n=1 Tax=Methanobacterium sp. TaxID=2164 RepID=UPI003159805E
MKLEMVIKFLILFVVIMLFIFPTSAEGSSTSSQTVSVTIPETTAVSANYGNSSTIFIGPISQGTNEITINNVYFANPSNVDTEIWIKASGDLTGTSTASTISLSNLKYIIPGLGAAGELTDQYTKACVLKKPKQGSSNSGMGVDLQLKIPYGTTPDTYTTTIYFTSLKFNSDAPV